MFDNPEKTGIHNKERLVMGKANKAYRFSFKEEHEGIVGVGTLIVFIAMILVAAIAAAVIIKTAYSLKNQAERVGQEAAVEATGPPQIISIVGDRGAAVSTDVTRLEILITTFVPSSSINISKLKVEITTGSAHAILDFSNNSKCGHDLVPLKEGTYGATHETSNGAGDTNWIIGVGGVVTLAWLDDDDVVKLIVELNPLELGLTATLGPGSDITIKLIPEHGPVLGEEVRTPTDYGTDRYIDLTSY